MHRTTHRKSRTLLGLLGALYFSQGLPFGFFTQTVPVLLRDRGLSLGYIGLASLLAAPWAFKFLWAPLVDRFGSTRRVWIIPLQAMTALVLLVLAHPSASNSLTILLSAVFLLNLLAATQDIATDALAVDQLTPSQRGLGNGLQVAAYRVGMIVGGGAILVALDHVGWTLALLSMALLIMLASLQIIGKNEVKRPAIVERKGDVDAGHFLRQRGAWRLLSIVVIYKFGDAFASGMVRPFLRDSGCTLTEMGVLLGVAGFVAGLAGALIGGALVNRLGRRRALLSFGLAQTVAVSGYAWTSSSPSLAALAFVSVAEHLAGGMATAALFTCMMDWSRPTNAATDYTVLASAVVIATGLASTLSGFSAGAIGYGLHFLVSCALSVLGTLGAFALMCSRPNIDEPHHWRTESLQQA